MWSVQVSAKLDECRQAVDRRRHSMDVLVRSLRHYRTQLNTEIDKLRQDLDRCAEELQCKLEAAERQKAQMEVRTAELQQQTDKLSSFITRCRKAIDSDSAVELLRSSSKLSTEANKLINAEVVEESELYSSSLRVVFTPTSLRQFLPRSDVNLVGTVSVAPADAQTANDENQANELLQRAVSPNQQKGYVYFLHVHFLQESVKTV